MRKLLLASLVAMVLSYVIGLVLAMFIPVIANYPECSPIHDVRSEKKQFYTMEEIGRAEAEMKKRVECIRRKDRELSALDFILLSRESGKWLTWIPWLGVPLLARMRCYLPVVGPIVALVALSIFKIFLPLEAVLSSVALIAGIALMGLNNPRGISDNA